MARYDLAGKAVLITGATDGLGRGLADAVAAAGGTLLLHGRDPERLQRVEREVRERHPNVQMRSYRADFSALAEVEAVARGVQEREERLDVLVNNAGIGANVPGGGERQESADGIELRFAVNYLAGYVLTRRLLELLQRSAPARIVNVSSAGQMALDFDDLMLEHDYNGTRAYCQSKLAQILFTFTLAEELKASGVAVTALHPATYMPTKIVPSPASTLEEGVQATMRLVADPELADLSGVYFNRQRRAEPDPQALDPAARRALESASRELVAAHLGGR